MPYKDIRKRRKYDREYKRKIYPKTPNLNSNPPNIKYEAENDIQEGLKNGLDKKDRTISSFLSLRTTFTAEEKLKYAKLGINV